MSTFTPPLAIPPLYCPFPLRNHPAAPEIDRASVDWMVRGGLADPARADYLRRQHVASMATHAMPGAPTDRVQVLADFVTWSVIDDRFDQSPTDTTTPPTTPDAGQLAHTMGRVIRSLESPSPATADADPWVAALIDVRARLAPHTTSAQRARWINAFRTYSHGIIWEAHYRTRGELPSLNDYLTIRILNGVVRTFTALNEYVEDYRLTDDALAQPAITALSEITWMLVGLDNDFVSHYKEKVHAELDSGVCINLIDIVAHERDCSLAQAVGIAIALRDRMLCRYLRIRDAILPDTTPDLRRYIHGLDRWITGILAMAPTSERYLNPLDQPPTTLPWAELPTHVATEPTDDNPEPLPYPAIASWWHPATLHLQEARS